MNRKASRVFHLPHLRQPMLATLVAQPFHRDGWTYEEKYDGDRLLAYKEHSSVILLSRNGIDRTEKFPSIASSLSALSPKSLILDGEVVVFDKNGVSHFQLLQKGGLQPTYVIFDCLYLNGQDLRNLPLSKRQEALRRTVREGNDLSLSRTLCKNGLEAFGKARRAGYEGLVAKDLGSPYVEGRSRYWLKVKVRLEDEFIILGFTPPEGKREYFGALLLGAYVRGKLRYVGRVGSGFNARTLAALYRLFCPIITDELDLAERPPGKSLTFLKPRLVAQISYQELTADKKLRQPVFLGLRDDKSPRDVRLPAGV